MSKTNIIVCCHKNDFYHSGENFLPIQVGKKISKLDLGIQGDDTGDNISEKNPNFCELTAHYWLWKNSNDSDYVGLNHYRRYFDFQEKGKSGYFYQNFSDNEVLDELFKLPDLDKLFETYDVIMAKPMIYSISLEAHYALAHDKHDLEKLKETIQDLYPEYIEAFNRVMSKNRLSLCNMFIMRSDTFKDYSSWIFNILFSLEKNINISSDPYQSRIFGFMAERLLNVYVEHNHLRVKYYPLIKISNDKKISFLKGFIKNLCNNIAFWFTCKGNTCKIRY